MQRIENSGGLAARIAQSLRALWLVGILLASGMVYAPPAEAARCTSDSSGNWSCTHQQLDQSYHGNNGFGSCTGFAATRHVRWQVPEGTPPAGGWDVVFYYNGTVSTLTSLVDPFSAGPLDAFGFVYLPQIFHELLDDPRNTGRRYAVIAAEAPNHLGTEYWDTNSVAPYSASSDYCFLPALFNAVSAGTYGPAYQYNMNRRFAFGISSGGYNSSRMAATFNGNNNFKALGIVSASYATCSGAACVVPSPLPASHPPTKFWHGTLDTIVPIYTMHLYYDQLVSQGIPTEKVEHNLGHQFTADDLGSTGVRAFFDRH